MPSAVLIFRSIRLTVQFVRWSLLLKENPLSREKIFKKEKKRRKKNCVMSEFVNVVKVLNMILRKPGISVLFFVICFYSFIPFF